MPLNDCRRDILEFTRKDTVYRTLFELPIDLDTEEQFWSRYDEAEAWLRAGTGTFGPAVRDLRRDILVSSYNVTRRLAESLAAALREARASNIDPSLAIDLEPIQARLTVIRGQITTVAEHFRKPGEMAPDVLGGQLNRAFEELIELNTELASLHDRMTASREASDRSRPVVFIMWGLLVGLWLIQIYIIVPGKYVPLRQLVGAVAALYAAVYSGFAVSLVVRGIFRFSRRRLMSERSWVAKRLRVLLNR